MLAQPATAWRPAITMLGFCLLLVALAFRSSERRWLTVFPAVALWVVAGFWCVELAPAPPSQSELARYADGLSRTVRGHVTRIRELPSQALPSDQDTDAAEWDETEAPPVLSFDLNVEEIESLTPDTSQLVPMTGGVRATLSEQTSAPTLHCGDILEAPMRLRVPQRYRDPGAWQYADFLAGQGIGAHASFPASLLRVRGTTAADVRCHLYAAQTWAAARMLVFVASRANHRLPALLQLSEEDAGMLNAMLFGDRDRLNHALRLNFERTGSFHLFVVSGMHVALLAGGLFWLARKARINEFLASIATIFATTLYALLTGFGSPVQRALMMSSVFLIARLLHRDRNVLNSLGAAVLGVLVLAPASLFEAGFQMTFLAIVAIAGIAIPLGEWSFLPYARAARNLDHLWLDLAMHPRLAQFRIMLRIWGEHLQPLLGLKARYLPAFIVRWSLWALELLLIGSVAEMVMVLPMALYFHRATLFALPANMFSIPMVAVLAPLALTSFLASIVSPWLAILPASMTSLLLHGIAGVISRVGHTQGADWRVPGPSLLIALIACLCWGACCWTVRHSRRSALVAVVILPVATVLVLAPERPLLTASALEVTAIDVGQGDSIFVAGPEGRTMLIDAGGPVGRAGSLAQVAQNSRFDIGEDVVSPYLWSRQVHRLDVVALTHAHSDHMGGMPAILRNFRPRELWVGIDPKSSAYSALLEEAATLGIAVRHLHAGVVFAWGGVDVSALAPAREYSNHGQPSNNDSLVLRFDYGRASVLLEGDAEAASERAMLADGAIKPVTLLKVGHHGSRTSTTSGFFAATTPKEAVVSVGRGNTFGHPRFEVISRIAAAHTRLFRTDEFGLSQFILTKDGAIHEIGEEGPIMHKRTASAAP